MVNVTIYGIHGSYGIGVSTSWKIATAWWFLKKSFSIATGWWLSHPFKTYESQLERMTSHIYEMENKKCSKPPTSGFMVNMVN
jgi:hypothetical protein